MGARVVERHGAIGKDGMYLVTGIQWHESHVEVVLVWSRVQHHFVCCMCRLIDFKFVSNNRVLGAFAAIVRLRICS